MIREGTRRGDTDPRRDTKGCEELQLRLPNGKAWGTAMRSVFLRIAVFFVQLCGPARIGLTLLPQIAVQTDVNEP